MIITGLPTGTQHTTAVNEAKLQRRNTQPIKRRGPRRSRVCSCDQPLSPSPCSSLGDNMACRHQSHWQLLINPLHKRQEIIRIDQSTRICVCMCVHLWVCVWGGPPEISWILISLKGKGLWFDRCAPAPAWVCVSVWWRRGWLTDWQACALWSPAWHLVGAYKWLTKYLQSHVHTHTPHKR